MKNFLNKLKEIPNELFFVFTAFITPIAPLLLTVGAFIGFDTLTGIMKAYKKGGWKAINSKDASQFISKSVLYVSAVILFYTLETFIVGDFLVLLISVKYFLTKVIATTLCIIELKSIDENYTDMYGYSIWSRFKDILRRAKETKEEIKELVE